MLKYVMGAIALSSCTAVIAEPRFYTEYKNDFLLQDQHYIDNSVRNNLRLGIQGDIFYFEAGGTEQDDSYGASFEAGYKWKPTTKWEFKGKAEGFQPDTFEGDVGTKLETEVRYYF